MAPLINTINYNPSHSSVNLAGTYKKHEEHSHKHVKKNVDARVKFAAIGGSVLFTAAYLFALAKYAKKGSFKIFDMFNIDFENMFKVMGLATSAVAGGLFGGLAADKKENRHPKLKEAVHQFLGNVVTPISIVGVAGQQIKKRNLSRANEIIMSGLAAIAGVGAGVIGGNWLASKVNKFIFKENDDRRLSVKDFGIHVDDLLTVAALTPIGDSIKGFISKALPAIFLICGYEAGTKSASDKRKD